MSFINSDFQRKHIGHYPFFKNLFVVVHDRYSTKVIFSFLVDQRENYGFQAGAFIRKMKTNI